MKFKQSIEDAWVNYHRKNGKKIANYAKQTYIIYQNLGALQQHWSYGCVREAYWKRIKNNYNIKFLERIEPDDQNKNLSNCIDNNSS